MIKYFSLYIGILSIISCSPESSSNLASVSTPNDTLKKQLPKNFENAELSIDPKEISRVGDFYIENPSFHKKGNTFHFTGQTETEILIDEQGNVSTTPLNLDWRPTRESAYENGAKGIVSLP